MDPLLISFRVGEDEVIISEESSAVIAYYRSEREDRFTGDVWLFNLGETPEVAPWHIVEKYEGPYQNSKEYCYAHRISTPITAEDFDMVVNEANEALIYFRGRLSGILADHWRPGQSALARVDSGAAQAMKSKTTLATQARKDDRIVFVYHNEVDNLVIEVLWNLVVAYYISKAEREKTGDVWLFNIGPTPDSPPWEQERCEFPFQNSSKYCYPHDIRTPILESDFEVQFAEATNRFSIYFRGKLVGILGNHQNPGKSSFAKIDSLAALAMSEEIPRPS